MLQVPDNLKKRLFYAKFMIIGNEKTVDRERGESRIDADLFR